MTGDVKHVQLKLPTHVHRQLRVNAMQDGKTLARHLNDLLAASVVKTTATPTNVDERK